MPIEWSEESNYKKELNKWNRPKRDGGMNANGYEEFPRMLYIAQKHPMSGKYEVALDRDVISLDRTVVLLDAQQFNATCQMLVQNEDELRRALDNGWRKTQIEAMEYREGLENAVAQAAAERAYQDRRMSEKAHAEAEKADIGAAHVAEIKEQPRVKKPMTEDRRAKMLENLAKARAARKPKAS